MIHIRKGELLKLCILRLPQIRAQSLPGDSGKFCASDSKEKRQKGADEHPYALLKDIGSVAGCHADIHDIRHDQRNHQFKKRLSRNTEGRENKIFFILPRIRKDTL